MVFNSQAESPCNFKILEVQYYLIPREVEKYSRGSFIYLCYARHISVPAPNLWFLMSSVLMESRVVEKRRGRPAVEAHSHLGNLQDVGSIACCHHFPSSAHTTSNRLFLAAYHRFGLTCFIHSIGAFLSVPVAAIIIIVAILSVLGGSSAHLIRYSEWLYL